MNANFDSRDIAKKMIKISIKTDNHNWGNDGPCGIDNFIDTEISRIIQEDMGFSDADFWKMWEESEQEIRAGK